MYGMYGNPFEKPQSIYCGDGPCDPFLRCDKNALLPYRFSTGRLLASLDAGTEYRCAELRIEADSLIKLFGYGMDESLPLAAGYDSSPMADDTMTNCLSGGAMAMQGMQFITTGMTVRIGNPYLCGPLGSGLRIERYPSWIDESVERKLREILGTACSVELGIGTLGCRFNLGSLVTHGGVFDYGTGTEAKDDSMPIKKHCGKSLRHSNRIYATCALECDHTESQHRHGTIVWADEDAERLENAPEQPFDQPKAFSPFVVAAAFGHKAIPSVQIRTGRSDLLLEIPRAPILPRIPAGGIAIPIRVWLFGHLTAAFDSMTCGLPSLSEDEILVVKRKLLTGGTSTPEGIVVPAPIWPTPTGEDE